MVWWFHTYQFDSDYLGQFAKKKKTVLKHEGVKVSSEQGSEPVQGTETKTENEQYFLRNRNEN